MWNELGISGGTAIVILIALYFIIKWAVKNGVKEAYKDITGKKPVEDIKNENVTPSGSPALVNPINNGIDEQEQNGVTVPNKADTILALIPSNLLNIFLLLSGGK